MFVLLDTRPANYKQFICQTMFKYILLSLLLIPTVSLAQETSDTIHVATDMNAKYYVIGGCHEMVVFQNREKSDTIFYDKLSPFTKEAYYKELKLIKLRQKPISKVDADEVFEYFPIRDSIVNVTKRLGSKRIHVTPRGYEVAFYNKWSKKNEIFEFCFIEGKLSSISRAATNTLPTNDVWTAFNLMPLKEEMQNLDLLIKKLRKMRTKQTQKH